jgi:uncharacterized membrane protein (DUF106 family)
MRYFNSALTALLDFLLTPFSFLDPVWILFVISMLAGVLMLLIFRLTSKQSMIKEVKNKMQAHLIEILLFKDSPRIILTAQKNLIRYNARYMKYAFAPMVYMILPMSLLLVHLDGWFGYRPLQIGESAIFSVKLSGGGPKVLSRISIEADKGLTVETLPLRILENGEINWRIRADTPGEHSITVNAYGHKVRKKIEVFQTKLIRLSKFRVGSTFLDILLHPGEGPIEEGSFINNIGIGYPSREIGILGWRTHWLVLFFILSIAGGLAFRRILKTEI